MEWCDVVGLSAMATFSYSLTQLAHSSTVGLDAEHLQQAASRHLDSHDYTAGHGLPIGHPQ